MPDNTAMRQWAGKPPQWDTPVIIEAHINGAVTRNRHPHLPVTHEEIAREAISCLNEGACLVHFHNTDFALKNEAAYEDYMKIWEQVKRVHPNALWYPTLSRTTGIAENEYGNEHIDLLIRRQHIPVSCMDPGASNLAIRQDENGYLIGAPYMFDNRMIAGQLALMRKTNTPVTFGVYEPGYLRMALHYIDSGLAPKGSSVDFYLLGDYGLLATAPVNTTGMPPSLDSLYFYLNMLGQRRIPWYLSIWGAGNMDLRPIMKRAVELGGHLRVGLEMYYNPGKPMTNVELYREAREIARETGRPIATREEYLSILKGE